jgi:AraC-like DNA-binding protein
MRSSPVRYLNIQRINKMLLSNTIHPSNTIYYRGALVLKTIQQEGRMSMSRLYTRVKATYNMNYSVLVLCLDWLYLINAVRIDKKGEVSLCI